MSFFLSEADTTWSRICVRDAHAFQECTCTYMYIPTRYQLLDLFFDANVWSLIIVIVTSNSLKLILIYMYVWFDGRVIDAPSPRTVPGAISCAREQRVHMRLADSATTFGRARSGSGTSN